jgi:HEAT repeat protein
VTDHDRVREMLRSEDAEVRRLGTMQLPALGRAAPELLLVALADSDWRVRKEATQIASKLPERQMTLSVLVQAMGDREQIALRNAAVMAMSGFGKEAVAACLQAYPGFDADARKLVIEVLATIAEPAAASLTIGAMDDADANVRVAAAEGLAELRWAFGEIREQAIAALRKALGDTEVGVRLSALVSLSRLGAELPLDDLAPLLDEPLLAASAYELMPHTQDPGCVSLLCEGILRPGVASRAATVALAGLVEEAREDAPGIERLSGDFARDPALGQRLRLLAVGNDLPVRSSALLLLGVLGDPADVSLLVDALGDPDVAYRAELSLQLFGEDVVAPLLSASKDAPPEVRGTSLSMVPLLEGADSAALEALRSALSDQAAEVVVAALRSLSLVGQAADLPRVSKITLARDPRSMEAARSALRALAGRFPSEALELARLPVTQATEPASVCLLVEVVAAAAEREGERDDALHSFVLRAAGHGDAAVRRAALDALSVLGGDDAEQACAFGLADEEDEVTLAAVRGLGRLGQVSKLLELVHHGRDPAHVGAALRALADADPERAVAAATPLLRAKDARIASAAIEAMRHAGTDAYERALAHALGHEEPDVVKLALAALPRDPTDSGALPQGLGMSLLHSSADVRRLAADLLGELGGEEARGLLRARLTLEGDAAVREAISAALRREPTGAHDPVRTVHLPR